MKWIKQEEYIIYGSDGSGFEGYCLLGCDAMYF
jgi:hypothetical protein